MEEDIFLKKMKGVRPLKKENNILSKHKEKNKITAKKTINTKPIKKFSEIKEYNNTEHKITFGEINKDLKKGRVKIDRRIDLHGYSLNSAYEIFKKEIVKTYNNNKRCLLIVTGKGLYKNKIKDQNEEPRLFYGKIKNSIKSWVNEDGIKNYVLTYQDAGIEHGGDGAIFIYLRKKKH
tara:strand:+ start:184 stop:717 length:534 start_codon:yes stop_codon:yes gene_type:complete